MKIAPEWLTDKNLQVIFWSLGRDKVFAVGGCVRDSIIGRPVNDIDLATSLHPSEVKELLENISGVVLYPTGIEHGTWTVSLDHDLFEITTFRRDVETDGRRATVAYAETMLEDAQRRDFTMNALYMDFEGNVFDPVGTGIDDLQKRQIRFVGDADTRCREDYLRILRLFRFHAQIGSGQLDNVALDAVKRNSAGLQGISGERKWAEIKKILGVVDPFSTLLAMECSGVLGEIMPGHTGLWNIDKLVNAEQAAGFGPKWERRYAMLTDESEIPFPCSRAEQKYIDMLHQYQNMHFQEAAFYSSRVDVVEDCYLINNALRGTFKAVPMQEIRRAAEARCPVSAQDILAQGVKPGLIVGKMLKRANEIFMENRLRGSREDIMAEVISDFNSQFA